jgi:hypothetical protein
MHPKAGSICSGKSYFLIPMHTTTLLLFLPLLDLLPNFRGGSQHRLEELAFWGLLQAKETFT